MKTEVSFNGMTIYTGQRPRIATGDYMFLGGSTYRVKHVTTVTVDGEKTQDVEVVKG